MEVLELQGYSEEEKIQIANRHLILKQTEEHGINSPDQIEFTTGALAGMIRHYTREAGVRNLEREIATVCRKQARRIAEGKPEKLLLTPDNLRDFLGIPRYRLETEIVERTREPGVMVGLAWTPTGGDVLYVEASAMKGSKGFTMTGHVGQVMQESMQAALAWVRAHAADYGIDPDFFQSKDIHIHVPSGAIPKDGPSAGVTMVACLVSALTRRPSRQRLAMTGEITLSGQVLPVGGIKEKVLAAKRAGVVEVILPADNEANVYEDLNPDMLQGLTLHFVKTIKEVVEQGLEKDPVPETTGRSTRDVALTPAAAGTPN
jgi:ATP-dependent Lon protease